MNDTSSNTTYFGHRWKTEGFTKTVPGLGSFQLRQLRLREDIPRIHHWVNQEYASYWQMQNTTPETVRNTYKKIIESEHKAAFTGLFNTIPAFILECYDTSKDPVGQHYDTQKGDCGMHILIAPADTPLPGFSRHVFALIMDFIFSDPNVKRIVVEPDVRNKKIHLLNKKAGFQYQKKIQLPGKTAFLAFCTKQQYINALKKENLK